MSIIYEALKKTQNSSKNITADIVSNTGQEQNPKKAGKIPYALASVIVIGLGFIFSIFLGKPQELYKASIVRKSEINPSTTLRIDTERGVIFPRPKGRGLNAAERIKESVSRAPSFANEHKNSPPIPSSSFSFLPSQGAPKEEKNLPDFVVNGIVISPDGNIALINDQIIRAGDNIEGARVERIEDSRVVLSYEGRETVLKSK